MRKPTPGFVTRRDVLRTASAVGLVAFAPRRARAQAKEPARFGVALPLTGSQALYGKDQVKAAVWAVEDINAKGGAGGRKLEMVVLDTQADAQVGINAVNRLVSVEKVPVFVAGWSVVVKAVAPIANREKTLELAIGANSPDIAHLGDYVYTAFPLADIDVTALANYTYSKLGKRRVAILYINNDTGVDAAKVYRTVFGKAGGQVVAYEAYDPKATDYTGMLLKVKSANPDMVHIHGLVSDLPQVIAQMRQLGMQQRVSSYSVGYNPKILQQLGKAAEGLIVTSLAPGVADNKNVQAYLDRWNKAEGRVPNGLPYTQYLFDAPYLVAALYEWVEKQHVPATGETMRKALLTVREFDLPLTGTLVVGHDHTVRKPVYLVTVENGKFVALATIP